MERGKESIVYLDTHVVCWLYEGETEKLTDTGINTIDSGTLFVSPMVVLELQYLYEINRIRSPHSIITQSLMDEIGLTISETPLKKIVEKACTIDWTRDPFDRLITAETLASDEALLLTKDTTILNNCDVAIW